MTDSEGWLVLANGAAGSAERHAIAEAVARLAQRASVRLVWTDGPEDLVPAMRSHPDRVPVVAGGDGTVSAAAQQVMRAGLGDTPLGILPAGTGNDLARGVGLGVDPVSVADRIAELRPRALDAIAVDDDRRAVNAVHAGIGAASATAASSLKPRLGRLAYPIGSALTGLRFGAVGTTVEADGSTLFDGPALMVAVVVGSSIGGGAVLSAAPSAGSGTARVIVGRGERWTDRVRLAAAVGGSSAPGAGAAEVARSSRVLVHFDRPVPVNADGEDLGESREVSLVVEQGAWTCLVPPDLGS